jgi:hypothetical protein
MIISFSVFKEKIESGEKGQTIRKYSPKQYQRYLNCWKKRETTGRYNLFWHNPRNGGKRIRDAIPSMMPRLMQFNKKEGFVLLKEDLTISNCSALINKNVIEDLARSDRFANFQEMIAWFEKEYGGEDPYKEIFIIIRWLPPNSKQAGVKS